MKGSDKMKRNGSIDFFRYICAILVVAIHTHPFTEINNILGELCTDIIPKFAVPYFFAVSGFFYMSKLENNENCFFYCLKKLMHIYLYWSCIYYCIDFIVFGYKNPLDFLVKCIYKFFLIGSHYHFWYFPALIISICLTTIIYRLNNKIGINQNILMFISIFLYCIGVLGVGYFNFSINLPIFGDIFKYPGFKIIRKIMLTGFPFFICGWICCKFNIRDKTKKNRLVFLIVSIFLMIAEVILISNLKCGKGFELTFSLYFLVSSLLLWLVNNPNIFQIDFRKYNILANFAYYSHPLIIDILNYGSIRIINWNISPTLLFVLVIILTYSFATFIYKTNLFINKFI